MYPSGTCERARDFDPVAEGARYRLRPAVAQAIWDGAQRAASDASGRRDEWQARQRFHAVAARVMARGGWLRPGDGAGGAERAVGFRLWRDERVRRGGRPPAVAVQRSTATAPAWSPALDPGRRNAPPARPDRAQALDATPEPGGDD